MYASMRRRTAAVAGTAALAAIGVIGAAGAASATAPAMPPAGHHHHQHWRCGVRVVGLTSGAFSNNQDILHGWIVPGSVSVVATQGQPPGQDPPVDTFGPGTGYTVSPDWHTVTLQSPYAGSNDGFTTYYSVFVPMAPRPWFRHMHCQVHLRTFTSGAFSNNQDILTARNIVPGSVFVVATQGQSAGYDNPSVNGFMENNGYTVAYGFTGATVTLQPPYAGSNDGFTTYYTVAGRHW